MTRVPEEPIAETPPATVWNPATAGFASNTASVTKMPPAPADGTLLFKKLVIVTVPGPVPSMIAPAPNVLASVLLSNLSVKLPPAALVQMFWASVLVFNVFQGLYYGIRTALFMDVTTPKVAATQFTAYMALMNVAISYSATWQGWAVEHWGYPVTLTVDALAGLVCLACLPFMSRPPKPVEPAAPGAPGADA